MKTLLHLLKTDRKLQLFLAAVLLTSLLLLRYREERSVDTSANNPITTSVPARLSLKAPSQTPQNKDLIITIKLDTKGNLVNTVTTDFNYPTNLLEFKEVEVQNSFVKLWVEKREQDGTILLTGALPTPGFGGNGTVAEVVFTPRSSGTARFSFTQDAAAYADQTNANILGGTQENEVKIVK